MPFKSGKQRRFFQMCKHKPGHAKGKCPDRKTIEKFVSHKGAKSQADALEGS